MIELNEQNIINLTKSKKSFLEFSEGIEETFGGPSSYFYIQVIKNIRENRYRDLFSNNHFFEYLYATLCSWGMHRMDKNTRMADFEIFKNSIIQNKNKFIEISGKKLKDTNIEEIKEKLLEIFRNLKIMDRDNAPKLVAHSKIMHFLLPDLIPPIDKGNVVFFFYGRWKTKKDGKKYKYIPSIENEEKLFIDLMKQFQIIANKLNLNETDLRNKWDTSIPKIIDNAIIGYNKMCEDRENDRVKKLSERSG